MSDESVRSSIVAAMKEVEEKSQVEETTEETEEAVVDDAPEKEEPKTRDEKGKFVKKEATEVEPPAAPEVEPPKSWAEDKKAKFKELPEDVRAYILQREDEVHKQFTKQDDERNFGKSLKEVITPYLPIINAEGGTPATAVQSLLNTAYLLRTGTAQQKAHLIQQIAQQYGVDLASVSQEQPHVDPYIKQLEGKLQQLEQNITQQSTLQHQQEYDKNIAEVQAFAANPANKHFEAVKPQMAALLSSGQAKDLQEAYETACWANPSVRSMLLEAKEAEKAAKRKEEMEAKKKAAVSVQGSPAKTNGNAHPQRDLREELRENLRSMRGSKI